MLNTVTCLRSCMLHCWGVESSGWADGWVASRALPQNSGGQDEQAGNAIAGCAAIGVGDAPGMKVVGSSAPAEAALPALWGGPLAGSLQACASSSAFRSSAVGVMV